MKLVVLLFLFCVFVATDVRADFFQSNGYHPFKALIGIPVDHAPVEYERGRLGKGWQVALQIDHSNIFSGGSHEEELLQLDGETTRVALSLNRRISDCAVLAAHIPFVSHHPGFLDGFIENWHDVFLLPSARRELSPRDQLNFLYQGNARDLQLQSDVAELADIQVNLAWHSGCGLSVGNPGERTVGQGKYWFRVGAELPLGRPEHLTGNGSLDWFFDVTTPALRFGATSRWTARASLGVVLPGTSEDLVPVERQIIYASGLLKWRPGWLDRYSASLLAQFDLQGRAFDSSLRELGALGGQLATGMRIDLGARRRIDLALLEDIVVDTAPDLVLHLRYQASW